MLHSIYSIVFHLPRLAWQTGVIWWWASNWTDFVRGIPALLTIVSVCLSIGWVRTRDDSQLAEMYEQAAITSARNEDVDAAMLFLQRAEELAPKSHTVRFALAELLLTTGKSDFALRKLQKLAPNDESGYWPAHLKIAKSISDGRQRWTPQQVALVTHHLQQVVSQQATHAEAHEMLADVLIGTGKLKQAMPHLEVSRDTKPRHRIALARAYRSLGEETKALRELRSANDFFQSSPPTTDDDIVLAAQAYALQNEFEAAGKILHDRHRTHPSQPIKRALVGTLAAYAEYLRLQGADLASRLHLLELALDVAPESHTVLVGIATFVYLDGKEASRARELLEEALVAGRAPAAVHLILGTRALLDDDLPVARTHLEAARAINSNLPDVLNNLSVIELKAKQGDPERGLALVNQALEWSPNNVVYRETRAQLLVAVGRTDEAIIDLEAALAAYPNERVVREQLAKIYAEKGMTTLAEKHRERLSTIK